MAPTRCLRAAYPTTMEVDQALAAGAAAAVVNRSPRGPRGRASPTAATATGAAAAAAAAAAATATAGGDGLVTLGTEDVSVSVLREAAVAGIRVRERQILQRTQVGGGVVGPWGQGGGGARGGEATVVCCRREVLCAAGLGAL